MLVNSKTGYEVLRRSGLSTYDLYRPIDYLIDRAGVQCSGESVLRVASLLGWWHKSHDTTK